MKNNVLLSAYHSFICVVYLESMLTLINRVQSPPKGAVGYICAQRRYVSSVEAAITVSLINQSYYFGGDLRAGFFRFEGQTQRVHSHLRRMQLIF